MNRALTYLWFTLVKRRMLQFIRGLRRPTTLIGIAALVFFLGFLFLHRRADVFAQFVRPASLIGGALVMLGGSLFKGFLQRGLVFEPPDVEFVFTSPFTQRQVVFYRLLPNYSFAVIQGLVFLALFATHLKHPWMTLGCVILFQIVCFHLAAGAAIFAGTISEQAHHRIRWMLLGVYCVVTMLYLRAAWELKFIPSFVSSPLFQGLFYPALTLRDLAGAAFIRDWAVHWSRGNSIAPHGLLEPSLYLSVLGIGAILSLSLLLKLKANIFETSFATTARAAEKRRRLQEGRGVIVLEDVQQRSVPLPKWAMFRGVGAIAWKNLVVASRSKRQLVVAAVFASIYIGFIVALRWVLHREMAQGGELPEQQIREFDNGLAGLMCFLAFLLQRAFPFDFRRDGQHLVNFRTLPISPFALALAEISVPVVLCLGFQAVGIVALMSFARFDWLMFLFMLLAYPAVALALNGVWNIHYLLAAARRAGGQTESASPVALLMVVVLSFLVFYPAGWSAVFVGKHFYSRFAETLAFATGLVVQYLVDFVLLVLLARLFQRFEVSRDS